MNMYTTEQEAQIEQLLQPKTGGGEESKNVPICPSICLRCDSMRCALPWRGVPFNKLSTCKKKKKKKKRAPTLPNTYLKTRIS
ncbi:hypothetical protein POVWA2_005220 [Plasmodium ovale wallikeri]|uniref:Uncharacterized protein n=1 Tax=Plasmodium ovale wallikeri TaxID=864142 RepID=A0A1A8YJD1_PLAOA|nr:hypothetical protein POVWA2_005220 [Plasmodium ovale wallikeri]